MAYNIPDCSSSLATYYVPAYNATDGSSNVYERTVDGWDGTIDTITIHCYVGQVTAKRGVDGFSSRNDDASCNYVVGCDGLIGLSVPESKRSACTSSRANDKRAVTIEVASDSREPYAVNDKAYSALIELIADVCRRNNIKKLVWSENKADRMEHRNGCNMTVHRDYTNKTCPGTYLYERHGIIAAAVNARIAPAFENFRFTDVTAGSICAAFKACEFFSDYSWTAQATTLEGGVVTKPFNVSSENASFSLQGLQPDTFYDISILTKDRYNSTTTLKAGRIMTAKDYPNDILYIRSQLTQLTSNKLSLSITIEPPNNFLNSSQGVCGYRTIFYVDGKEAYSSDSLIAISQKQREFILTTTDLGYLIEHLNIVIPFESTLQIGIQTWVQISDRKLFSKKGPVCTDTIYARHTANKIDKLFLNIGNKITRAILHCPKLKE